MPFYFYSTKLVILIFCSVVCIGKLVNNVYIIRILLRPLLQNQVSYYDYIYLPVWLYFSSIVKFPCTLYHHDIFTDIIKTVDSPLFAIHLPQITHVSQLLSFIYTDHSLGEIHTCFPKTSHH